MFTLEAQEERMFLLHAKSYAMAAAAVCLSVIPGVNGLFGQAHSGDGLGRRGAGDEASGRCSTSAVNSCRRWMKVTSCTCRAAWPVGWQKPQALQQTDQLIKTVPEVQSVRWQSRAHGTATDGLSRWSMFGYIQLKPKANGARG
jgi:Cu/Ag efflux pump CusA